MNNTPDEILPYSGVPRVEPKHQTQCEREGTYWSGVERRQPMLNLMDDINQRLNRQDDLLLEFHKAFIQHTTEAKETKELLNELLDLYKGGKFMVTLVKFFVPIVAAVAALFLWIKDHLK